MILARHILFMFVGISLLLGQLPYQSLYCRMMNRPIDTRMLRCCMKHQATADKRFPRLVASAKAMQVLEKPTIGVFDKNHLSDRVFVDVGVAEILHPLFFHQTRCRQLFGEAQHSPPDIVILNLNLRI